MLDYLISFCALFFTVFAVHADNNIPPLIPQPEKVEWQPEYFELLSNTSLIGASSTLNEYFKENLKSLSGLSLKSNRYKESKNQIVLNINPILDTLNSEAYTLTISKQQVKITGASDEGLFRGIQTFFQMIPVSAKSNKNTGVIKIRCCLIQDKPVFVWRGLNLDCCRHFMSKEFVKRYLDILAYYKFNRLHWHLTEDQGWRIEIKKYPKLTEVGAWRKEANDSIYGGFYTQDDIREIVAYAKERFIIVVPEIELPGHSIASLASYPENSCTGGPFEVSTIWGVRKDIYCAGRDSTFTFLQNILDEVMILFPDQYIHIGGDEAPKDRWKDCYKCQARIKSEDLQDEGELQSYFIKRIANYLESKYKKIIGWDEILEGGLAPGAIVQSWRGLQGAIDAAKSKHYAISSPTSHTYFDYDPDNLDLRTVYSFEPVPTELTSEESNYILGGEANMWTENAPQETIDSKLFPRLLALAEVLWKNPQDKNYDAFYSRVQHAYKDLEALGIEYGRETKVIQPSTNWIESEHTFEVSVINGQKGAILRYTLDGSTPDSTSILYSNPVKIDKTSILKIAAFMGNQSVIAEQSLDFIFHKALGAKIKLCNNYHENYQSGGTNSVINGMKGSNNFRDGLWQGYEGVNFEVAIDLGSEQEISSVTPSFFFDSNSWIFLPEKVTIAIAQKPDNFTDEIILKNDIPQKSSEIIIKDFAAEFGGKQARYIRVQAENIKKCPEWHPGVGGLAWLFIDEIVVE